MATFYKVLTNINSDATVSNYKNKLTVNVAES